MRSIRAGYLCSRSPWVLAVLILAGASWGARAQTPTPSPTPVSASGTATREPALDRDEARRLGVGSQVNEVTVGAPVELSPRVERKRLSELRDILSPSSTPESALRIKALEGFLDYNQEDQIIYGPGRTQIFYGQYLLEGDKVIIDTRLQEVQAEGNVILKTDKDNVVHADSMRYNFHSNEGVGYNVSGSHSPLFFKSAVPVKPGVGLPQFQQVSKDESIFRNTDMTACDFKIPHYSVKGREVVMFSQDRVFMRGATFYVWEMPVFYLPYYTHSLTEASPWSTELGDSSRTGFRIRQEYTYHHRTEEPSLDNDSTYEVRSQGKADVFMDYLSNHGLGAGFDYDYSFDFDRNRGEFSTYGLDDTNRVVTGAKVEPGVTPDTFQESQRWTARWLDRLAITPDLTLTVDVDEFSDPDVFYDILDFFGTTQDRRERQVERGARVDLTWVQEAYVMHLMAGVRDRIGIDRWNDFTNPRDDNFDFDADPSQLLQNSNVDGISSKRWGRVSEKLPQYTFATRDLPFGRSGFFYNAELNVYNSLDKGLNVVSTQDDAFVRGAEFYQQIMKQWKLGQRYVLLWKAGFGVGAADRDDSLGPEMPTPPPGPPGPPFDGLTFVDDKGTFLAGTRKRNLDEVKDGYIWGDTEVDFNARFSDSLRGNLSWKYRDTTRDFLGDFYASIGDTTFREDLYDYKIRQNLLNAHLEYRLAQPLLTIYTDGQLNMEPNSKLYSKEEVGHLRVGYNWSNQRQTIVNSASTGYTRTQLFDPTDPNQFQQNTFDANWNISYSPVHQRWYTKLALEYYDTLNGNVEASTDPDFTFFSDQRPREELKWTYGRELGPKWTMEYSIDWDREVGGLRQTSLLLQRDMHDAILTMRFEVRNKDKNIVDATQQQANQVDVRFGIKMKLPEHDVGFGAGNVQTLKDRAREPAQAY